MVRFLGHSGSRPRWNSASPALSAARRDTADFSIFFVLSSAQLLERGARSRTTVLYVFADKIDSRTPGLINIEVGNVIQHVQPFGRR